MGHKALNRRSVLKSVGAGALVGAGFSGVGTARPAKCESTPCGVEEECEAGTLFAKFEYNEDDGTFELAESTPFFDLTGVFEFTIKKHTDDGGPLKVCWTQSDSVDDETFEYLLGSARAKAGNDCTDFVAVDDEDCIAVDGPQAISNIQFCSPVLFQADLHTGESRETPEFTSDDCLIDYVYSRPKGELRRPPDSDRPLCEPLNGDLSEHNPITISTGFSTDGGGTASFDYKISADPGEIDDTSHPGVTEDSIVLTLDVYARPRRKLGPLGAQVLVGSATNTHDLGTEVDEELEVGLPDPFSCE